MSWFFIVWLRQRLTATVIARGSKAIDDLRGEIKRNVSILMMQMGDSHHTKAILEKGPWSFITKDKVYEWRFYLVNGSVAASCRLNYGEWVFSTIDKDKIIPLYEVVGVHKSVTELNEAIMKSFGGMKDYLNVFAKAAGYRG